MKNRQKVFLSLLFLFTMIFLSCSNPVAPDEVDPRLFGEWYYTVDNTSIYPSPQTLFYGIQITDDKNVKSLGIETETGKVEIANNSYKKIIKANQGKIEWQYSVIGIGMVTKTLNYKIEDEKLTLTEGNQNYTYTKTNLGAQLFEPVICSLSLKNDTTIYENEKISSYPSAYISKKSDSWFSLTAEFNHAYLTIDINNFSGAGYYEIPYNRFEFAEFHGDVGLIFVSDSLSTGNITITQYDELNRICSGTFYFNAAIPNDPDSVATVFKEGIFTVPVYK